MNKTFDIIVAVGRNREIGYKGNVPWPKLKTDLKFLMEKSTATIDKAKQNAVIMGRKTWESIPSTRRPLAKRFNVVITSMQKTNPVLSGAHAVFPTVTEAVQALSSNPAIESIYILGGAGIYSECMLSLLYNKIYYTDIDGTFDADTFFPLIDPLVYTLVSDNSVPQGEVCENGVKYHFKVYQRVTGDIRNSTGDIRSSAGGRTIEEVGKMDHDLATERTTEVAIESSAIV